MTVPSTALFSNHIFIIKLALNSTMKSVYSAGICVCSLVGPEFSCSAKIKTINIPYLLQLSKWSKIIINTVFQH